MQGHHLLEVKQRPQAVGDRALPDAARAGDDPHVREPHEGPASIVVVLTLVACPYPVAMTLTHGLASPIIGRH